MNTIPMNAQEIILEPSAIGLIDLKKHHVTINGDMCIITSKNLPEPVEPELPVEERPNITKYEKTGLDGKNYIEEYGYAAERTEEEMIQLAIENMCPVIVKNGITGKWYLKGRGRQITELKTKLEQNRGNAPRDGVYCILVEF